MIIQNKNTITPYVSVIIPLYNCEKYLPQCLQSLQHQSQRNFEVIMVDDGSTDASIEICNKIQETDHRFHFYKQNHQFAGAARNLGMSHAKGQYLLFLDSDDFFSEELIEKSYSTAIENDVDICVFGANFYDEQTSKTHPMKGACDPDKCPSDKIFSLTNNSEHIFDFTTPAPWTKLFRRDFIEEKQIRFQTTLNANDVCFVLTAIAEARRICTIFHPLVNYRINHGTSLQQTKDKDPTCICTALLGLQQELLHRDLYKFTRSSFSKLVINHCIWNLRSVRTKTGFKKLYEHIRSHFIPEIKLDVDKNLASNLNYKILLQWTDITKLSADEYIKKYSLFEYSNMPFQIPFMEKIKLKLFHKHRLELLQ